MMKGLIIICCSIILFSCSKESVVSTPKIELKWINDDIDFVFSNIAGIIQDDKAWIQLDNNYHILDINTGSLLKTIPTNQSSTLVGARNMIYEDGNIYIHTASDITAYNFKTGQQIWQIASPDQQLVMLNTEMVLKHDKLYVAKRGGCYIIDKATGVLQNTVDLNEIFNLNLAQRDIKVRQVIPISESEVAFAVAIATKDDGGFTALVNVENKQQVWTIHSEPDTTSAGIVYKPGVSKMDDFDNYLAFICNGVTVVDKHTGEIIWRKKFDDLGFNFGLEISEDGILYLGSVSLEIQLFAFDIKTGAEVWSRNGGKSSIAFLKEKSDYLISSAQHLYIYDKNNGTELADIIGNTGDFFFTDPILGEDCLIGVSSQRIYCYNY